MKKKWLVPEISEWINKLDYPLELSIIERKNLQDLLIHSRQQLISLEKELINLQPEDETSKEFKNQVSNEVQKMLSKLKK